MPDYPPSVLAAAALAIHRAACPLRDDPDHDCARDAAAEELFIPRARAALDTAAPLLAEAWGVKPDAELRAQFADLKAKWLDATMIESSAHRIAFDPSCQRIIGLGPRVIPLILGDMAAAQPHLIPHWFWALTMLTGNDEAAGEVTTTGAARKWLEWGRSQGLIPEVPGC